MQNTIFGYSEEAVRRQIVLGRNSDNTTLSSIFAISEFSIDKVIKNSQRILDIPKDKDLTKTALGEVKFSDKIKENLISERRGGKGLVDPETMEKYRRSKKLRENYKIKKK